MPARPCPSGLRRKTIALAAALLLAESPGVAAETSAPVMAEGEIGLPVQIIKINNSTIAPAQLFYASSTEGPVPQWTFQFGSDASSQTLINGSGQAGIVLGFNVGGHMRTYISNANDAQMSLKSRTSEDAEPNFLCVDNLELPMGSVTVGAPADPENQEQSRADPSFVGAILAVKKLTNDSYGAPVVAGATPSSVGTIFVRPGGVLALGTHFDKPNAGVDDAIANFPSAPSQPLARVLHVVERVGASATLILNNNAIGYSGGVHIVVGDYPSAQSGSNGEGIWIGSNGAAIVYCGESAERASRAATLASSTQTLNLHLASNATFVLYNWNGVDPIVFQPTSIEGARIYTIGGVRSQWNGTDFVRVSPASNYGALRAAPLVLRVASLEGTDLVQMTPGYRFCNDALDSTLVSNAYLGEAIDRAAFLPMASGFPAAAETAWRLHAADLMHRSITAEPDGARFWVMWTQSRLDAPAMFSAADGKWPVTADIELFSAGYDMRVAQETLVSFSAMGGRTDLSSNRPFAATTSEGSLGAAALTLETPVTPNTEFRALLLWAQASGDARQISLGHRLDADARLEHYAIFGRMTTHWQTAWPWLQWSPWIQAGYLSAELKKSKIEDSFPAASGTAFVMSGDKRAWWQVDVGLGLAATYTTKDFFPGTEIKVQTDLSYGQCLGTRDWRVQTAFADGTGASLATFEGTPANVLRLRGSIDIDRLWKTPKMQGGFFGLGAKPTGKDLQRGLGAKLSVGLDQSARQNRSRFVNMSVSWRY